MFKTLKNRLTFLYTASLLFMLAIFILVLYWFISGSIQKENMEDLRLFYQKESHDILEDFEDDDDDYKEHRGHKDEGDLELKPDMQIFYYLFDSNQNLIGGEEAISGFSNYVSKWLSESEASSLSKEVKWEGNHLLIAKFSLNKDGYTYGTMIVGEDITNEKHIIQNIVWILLIITLVFSVLFALVGYFFAGQAMKPIQKSFQMQKKFVSDASHELRTPLSIFYSSVDLLTQEEEKNLSPFGKEILEDVKKESELMNKLISDLLFLARTDNEQLKIEKEKFSLSEVMNALLKRMSRIIPEGRILKEEIEDQVWIIGDQARIEQLLYILLDNAIRYTKKGTITCTMKTRNQKIFIKIEDTGQGISKENLSHIFDRFFRADASRNREGSGLGLSIAKTIVEAHGGQIDVTSELDKGTTFIIQLEKESRIQ